VEKFQHHDHRNLNSRATRACGRARASSPATSLASAARKKMSRPAARPTGGANLENPGAAIHAVLISDDRCTALGLTAQSGSPVLSLCRQLVAAGRDPATPMHVFRGDTRALSVRSIGEGARLEVNHHGTGFIARPAGGPAPPIAPNAPARTGHRSMPEAAE
jgi:hypothetical protein